MAGASTRARELLAASAADTDSGLLSDVTELTKEGPAFKATRPMYAGKILSTAVASGGTTFITVRNRAFPLPEVDASRSGSVERVTPVLSEDQIASKIDGFEEQKGTVNLTDASIIVTGGRPVGSPEGFAPVRELAEVLGGAVGATRAAVDAGYIPMHIRLGKRVKWSARRCTLRQASAVRFSIRQGCVPRRLLLL